jgi:acetyl esterase
MTRQLHEESRTALARLEDAGIPPLHTLSVESARQTLYDFSDTDPGQYASERVCDFAIARSKSDGEDIPIRIYDPGGDAPKPLLLYIHGGGWVLGGLDSVDGLCRILAVESGCLVTSVSYRRAPEHQFPAQLIDVEEALSWLVENGRALGGDPNRIAVGGDSAGGNLAASLAIYAAKRGDSLAYQLLIYPVTDHAFDTDSYEENGEGYYITEKDMRYFWSQYLGNPIHGANPYASPLRHPDLSSVAPAYVMTCEFDPLRDEGKAYADRLDEAGVPVTYENVPDMIHGYVRHTTRMDRARRDATRAATLLADTLFE